MGVDKPDILFLDEPTSALDPVNVQNIYKILKDLSMEALKKVIKGKGFVAIQEHLLNNIIWTICLIILCMIVYKKKQLD